MVHFCEAVVQEIRSADRHEEVESIVDKSLGLLHESGSQGEWVYSINMIVMLRASKVNVETAQERDNLMRAVEIFRNRLKLNTSNLF